MTVSEERFWSKTIPEPNSGCWLWTAATTPRGYGVFHAGQGRGASRAHRIAYELTMGPVPDGLLVLHRCDNPSCVNPDHLYVGTHRDNADDREARSRSQIGDRHYTRRAPHLAPRGATHGRATTPERTARGEAHGCAKVTAVDVCAIRSLASQGHSAVALARRFGIGHSQALRIINRANWKHVG